MTRVQVVLRWKPKLTVYVRAAPVTITTPTPAQAEVRLRLAEASSTAGKVPPEEIARMVKGRVVYVDGKPRVELPDGRILLPHQAYVKAMLSGYKSPRSGLAEAPRWLREYRRPLALASMVMKKYKLQAYSLPREKQ